MRIISRVVDASLDVRVRKMKHSRPLALVARRKHIPAAACMCTYLRRHKGCGPERTNEPTNERNSSPEAKVNDSRVRARARPRSSARPAISSSISFALISATPRLLRPSYLAPVVLWLAHRQIISDKGGHALVIYRAAAPTAVSSTGNSSDDTIDYRYRENVNNA